LHTGFFLFKNTRKGKHQRVVIYNGKGFYDDYIYKKKLLYNRMGKIEIELKEKHGGQGS
jgi:hypothetical protein